MSSELLRAAGAAALRAGAGAGGAGGSWCRLIYSLLYVYTVFWIF